MNVQLELQLGGGVYINIFRFCARLVLEQLGRTQIREHTPPPDELKL